MEIRKLGKISFEPSGRRNEKIVIFLSGARSRKDSTPRSARKINTKTGRWLIPVISFLNKLKLYSVHCGFSIENFFEKTLTRGLYSILFLRLSNKF